MTTPQLLLSALSVLIGICAFVGAIMWANERGNDEIGVGETQGREEL